MKWVGRWPWGFSCCRDRCEDQSSASRWPCLCLCLRSWAFAVEVESRGMKHSTWSTVFTGSNKDYVKTFMSLLVCFVTVEKDEIHRGHDATSQCSWDFPFLHFLPSSITHSLTHIFQSALPVGVCGSGAWGQMVCQPARWSGVWVGGPWATGDSQSRPGSSPNPTAPRTHEPWRQTATFKCDFLLFWAFFWLISINS